MRLLALTHTFPPSRISNAKRPHYVVKGFLQAGWQVDVFTSRFGLAPGTPEVLQHPGLRIIRRTDPVDRFCERFVAHPALYRAFVNTSSGGMWPDEHLLWSLQAMRAARLAEQYDRVLVFILPLSLLLCGLPSRLVGPKWIFDLQESVTPYLRLHPRRSPLQRLMVPVLEKLERRTLHQAGRVIFTADSNRRTYIETGLVPESATTHIPYFFDADEFRAPAEITPERFQIVYLGVFDWRGARSPKTFLHSLARFLEQTPAARPHTEFLFHGQWLSEHDACIEELKLRDVVSIQPPLPYTEYIRQLRRSPVLLLVVAALHNLFMPSKIVDYFGARRPILAFTPRDSEMRQVLERAGMADYACDEFDVAAGTAALARLWEQHRARTLNSGADTAGHWSSEVQMPRYLDAVTRAGDKA